MRNWQPEDPHMDLFLFTQPEHRWLAWQHRLDVDDEVVLDSKDERNADASRQDT